MQSFDQIQAIKFFFIVGRGRSGTTLLQTMLDSNPSVAVPIESKLIIHLKQKYFPIKSWNNSLVEQFLNDLYTDVYFAKYWKLDRTALRNFIQRFSHEQLSFPFLCKLIYLSYASPFPKDKVLFIGDKNPDYAIFIPDLHEVFPDAKFIHLVRDPRDNVASFKKTFPKNSNINTLTRGWVICNEEIEKQKASVDLLRIRYEDLVSMPEDSLHKVCSFLGIEFESGMIKYSDKLKGTSNKILNEVMSEVHPNLLKPVSTDQVNKWKEILTDKEVDIIENLAGTMPLTLGYVPSCETGNKYTFNRITSDLRNRLQMAIVRMYYRMPFFVRKGIRSVSNSLNKWFGFSTVYNHEDFRFKE